MITRQATIINKLGLHARASAKLSQTASRFSSQVEIGLCESSYVDAKSIMALMMMAASQGTPINLRVAGEDEELAASELIALIEDYFGEGE